MADATVWRVASNLPAARTDPKLRDLLLHIHGVQRAFLYVWTERPVAFPKAADFPELQARSKWARTYYPEARQFDSVDSTSLGRPVTMPWVAEYAKTTGRRFETPTLGDTMFQVSSHSTYHRG